MGCYDHKLVPNSGMIISYIHSLLVMVLSSNMRRVVMLKETLLVLVTVILLSGCGTLAVTERIFGVPEKVVGTLENLTMPAETYESRKPSSDVLGLHLVSPTLCP